MNACVAAETALGEVDDLAPVEWRFWLASRLEEYAKWFKERSRPEHYGTLCQNAGFVHQVRAEEHEARGMLRDARQDITRALKWYKMAAEIRTRLRDPRMVAQTDVRVGQSHTISARIDCRLGNYRSARSSLRLAEKCADRAEATYRRIPQESIRLKHVANLRARIEEVRKMLLHAAGGSP